MGRATIVTALVYLNKVEAGGATQFPKLGITVPALPGRMVIFHNTTRHQWSASVELACWHARRGWRKMGL